jgi:hypothetical protein
MTPIGIVIAILALLLLVRAPQRLWELAILTTPFQAATLMDISTSAKDSGLAPVYLVLALACLVELWHWLPKGSLPRPIVHMAIPALCFLGWGICSAIAIPACFEGWLVVAPYSIYSLSRLEPSFSNMTHCLYLALLVLSMALLSLHVWRKGPARVPSLRRAYEAAVWVSAGIIVWHHLALYLGVPYPSDFLYNNAGVVHYEGNAVRPELTLSSGILRASGPFSEASLAAAYLGGGFGLMLAECAYGDRSGRSLFKCTLLGVIILSVISTSSFVVLGATLLFYLLIGAGSGRRRVATRVVVVLVMLLAIPLAILMLVPQARDEADLALNYFVLNKFDPTTEQSPRSRLVIEKNALQVFESSDGLGAGLGSNIAFTAQGYIASNTGIVGLGLCAWFARRMRKAYRAGLQATEGGSAHGLELRKLGGAMLGMIIAGLAGSHPLLFAPIWYMVLAMAIAGSQMIPRHAGPPRAGCNTADPPHAFSPAFPAAVSLEAQR